MVLHQLVELVWEHLVQVSNNTLLNCTRIGVAGLVIRQQHWLRLLRLLEDDWIKLHPLGYKKPVAQLSNFFVIFTCRYFYRSALSVCPLTTRLLGSIQSCDIELSNPQFIQQILSKELGFLYYLYVYQWGNNTGVDFFYSLPDNLPLQLQTISIWACRLH